MFDWWMSKFAEVRIAVRVLSRCTWYVAIETRMAGSSRLYPGIGRMRREQDSGSTCLLVDGTRTASEWPNSQFSCCLLISVLLWYYTTVRIGSMYCRH
jgi:hypothetical protein